MPCVTNQINIEAFLLHAAELIQIKIDGSVALAAKKNDNGGGSVQCSRRCRNEDEDEGALRSRRWSDVNGDEDILCPFG